MNLKKKTKKLEAKHGFRANPVLDQYFLNNKKVIERFVRYARINSNDTVLEIGPGLGYVTQEIAKKANKVIVIEKDEQLKKPLTEELSSYDNIEYIWKDCLEIGFPKFDKIISSLPYGISAPITFKIAEHDFEKASLMYQREFGEKMKAKPGESNYGRLSVMAQTHFNVKLKEIVPKTNFYPKPDVDSAIITLTPTEKEINEKYSDFIREIFRYRNKNLSNAIKLGFNTTIEDERKVKDLSIKQLEETYEKIKNQI